mmetsp:Transcript_30203/g.46075  ORF Transcript_30203/g.46075 Transcript_30203/m.46075 type:complete len:239 (-) Transcript_30203:163-879(-)
MFESQIMNCIAFSLCLFVVPSLVLGFQPFSRQDQQGLRTNCLFAGPSYCEKCGTPMDTRIPKGEDRERQVCTDPECGHVAYQNPKVVVGAICTYKDTVLLCQRAIEPCQGKWGYPQGFLELGETTRQGAARETWEEAGVKFDPSKSELLAIYNLAGMRVQMIYRVELESDIIQEEGSQHESSDIKFVTWDEVPWNDLAFPTVTWGLEHARDTLRMTNPAVQERTKLVTIDGEWKVEEG